MTERLALLIWAATPDRPELCVTPLVHALAARALDAEVEIHFAGPAVRLLVAGVADALYATPAREKSIGDFLREAGAAGASFYACSMAQRRLDRQRRIPDSRMHRRRRRHRLRRPHARPGMADAGLLMARPPITGVILAGGLGRRMGGVDKGLQLLNGRPLVSHVIERLAPQVDELLINANQNGERYAAFGYRVVADRIPGFRRPAGRAACRAVGGDAPAGRHRAVRFALPAGRPDFPPVFGVDREAWTNADLAVARTFDQPHRCSACAGAPCCRT